jgi:adenosylcobinamide-phosphate synthase
MIAAAFLMQYDGKNAFRIWRRDRRKHASPNSAQTEAACAGALGVRLAGPISYFGQIREKPYIGDDTRSILADDIISANRLMYMSSVLTLVLALLFRLMAMGVILFASL